MNLLIEIVAVAALPVVFLTVLRVLAGRGPEPDLSMFGPLGPGE